MRLEAWLRQDPTIGERLLLVERLAQAVNAAHGRGQLCGALEPSRIEVGDDDECDLSDALRGTQAAEYRAPERDGNAPSNPAADVYAAGAIVWEVLVGRPYAPAPSHLSEARPDLPADLADGVMACLERSPEWRPRDLAYVAQLAQQAAAQRGGAARASRPAAKPPGARREKTRKAAGRTPRAATEPRDDGGRSPRLLLILGALLAAVGAGAYFWLANGSRTETAATPRSIVPPPAADGVPAAEPTATPEAPIPAPTPSEPATVATPNATPTASATPRPTPTPAPVQAAASATVSRPPTPEPAAPAAAPATITPAIAPPTTTADAPVAPAPPPQRPELATLSPLSVKRPGRVLFDLHGTALTADLRARLIAVREPPRGLSIVRQKCSGALCNVLVELDDSVRATTYAIVLEDPQGRQTNALTFTVTR